MRVQYLELKITPQIWAILALLSAFIIAAAGAVLYISKYGHIVTGMNNQIVWGVPHIFAIFLIVAASGALNVASIGSIFGKQPYKPFARLSSLLAMALLIGGLAVLVLDLGRPDRLMIAMTNFNFKSIFAWNVLLYTGFLAVVAIYLTTQMMRSPSQIALKGAAMLAFLWRLALTTGTGSIFGWLVARQAYDAAIMAPMFIAMSFSFGLAFFILVMVGIGSLAKREFDDSLLFRQARLLGIFVAIVLYFTIVQHLSNFYVAEHQSYERFILFEGGIYTWLFWLGHIVLGSLLPIFLVFCKRLANKKLPIILAAFLVVLGGLAQLYVIVIGGQAFPLDIFPLYEVSSSFSDGIINYYRPALVEFILGLGGVALALIISILGMRILRILPDRV